MFHRKRQKEDTLQLKRVAHARAHPNNTAILESWKVLEAKEH